MYRQRRRACPACQSPMNEVALPEGNERGVADVDLCTRCGGVFFEFFDGEPANLSRRVLKRESHSKGRDEAAAARADVGALSCPDCLQTMERSTYLDLLEGPQIGRCDACFSVFVPLHELRMLATFDYDEEAVRQARALRRSLRREKEEDDTDALGEPSELDEERILREADRFFAKIRIRDLFAGFFGVSLGDPS